MGIPDIKMANEPAPGQKYIMECTLTVETTRGSVKFDGYATKEVVERFLDIVVALVDVKVVEE